MVFAYLIGRGSMLSKREDKKWVKLILTSLIAAVM